MSLMKQVYRFIYYKHERNKSFRELGIRRKQNKLIKEQYKADARNLIIFYVPGADLLTGKDNISGGVLSIASLYKETKLLEDVHHAQVIMCTFPQQPLLLKHLNFENDITVYRSKQALKYFDKLEKVILHVPELFVENMMEAFSKEEREILGSIPCLHINILNQNVRLMPKSDVIRKLEESADKVTITTAHNKYCTPDLRKYYGVPLHHYSTFASPENYRFTSYQQKENLLLLSPDDPKKNEEVRELMKNAMPHLEVRVIKGLKYEDYKSLIGRAKWSLTFGEGLDFYFIEPVFSGAISFAIYNELFFTPAFKNLKTVYQNHAGLIKDLPNALRLLDEDSVYKDQQKMEFDLCADLYSYQRYKDNIRRFYRGDYTYV
jgi:hypothetical protein